LNPKPQEVIQSIKRLRL